MAKVTAQAKRVGMSMSAMAHKKMHAGGVTGDRAWFALRMEAIRRRRKGASG